jgi:hypothetical protein
LIVAGLVPAAGAEPVPASRLGPQPVSANASTPLEVTTWVDAVRLVSAVICHAPASVLIGVHLHT